MKTLIILAHPNIANSLVNRHWRDAVLAHPDKFELHDLYALYADFKIDVEKEQKLLESHDKIVLQFPFRFSNCTPLLKQWFEDVFTRGWAYGAESGGKRVLVQTPATRAYFGDQTLPETEQVAQAREEGLLFLTQYTELADLGTYTSAQPVSFEYSPPGASNLPVNIILMPEK